jgi:hypothetical protein
MGMGHSDGVEAAGIGLRALSAELLHRFAGMKRINGAAVARDPIQARWPAAPHSALEAVRAVADFSSALPVRQNSRSIPLKEAP